MTDEALDTAHWEAAEEGAELIREGELNAAIHELSELIQRDPKNPYGFHFLGSAFFESKEFAKALKAYLSAVELKPDYVGALMGAGWSLHSLGRYRDALRVGRQVLLKSKDDPDALHLMGLCHYSMGDAAAALGYLTRFLATQPEIEVALEVEGLIKVLRGEVQALPEEDEQDDD
ncbi:MAG: tetratricopeptide repeat protein [Myxococcales bacterium]